MANYTINEIPDEATEAGNSDLAVLWQNNKTKKISVLNFFKNLVKKSEMTNTISTTNENPITAKAVSSLLTISASSATITNAPPLQNGTTIRFFFTSQITGSDNTTALAISYNGTSYNVKATANGALKDFTANAVETEQTRELTKGGKKSAEKGEEEENGTKSGTRATVTTYVYCQAYTTIEMMFDGTQFIIMGNPVVISNADYTIYTDGSITYKYANFHVENINGNSGFNFNDFTGQQLVVRGYTTWALANTPWGDIYCPLGGFVLLVCRTDNNIIQVCFYEYGNQRIAMRTNIGGTWNAWKQY